MVPGTSLRAAALSGSVDGRDLGCTPTHWAPLTVTPISLLSISVGAFVKTWLPFVLLLGIILTISLVFNLR